MRSAGRCRSRGRKKRHSWNYAVILEFNNMNEEELRIRETAKRFAARKENQKKIIQELSKDCYSSSHPSVWFMAGSPGAGKTETAKELVKRLEEWHGHKVVLVDPDTIRSHLPGYGGGNAHLFQLAVTNMVHVIVSYLCDHAISFLLDGTFANGKIADENVKRALSIKNAQVGVYYIHLDPLQAWNFTQKREALEGRRIRKEVFIRQYYASREAVKAVKDKFGARVSVLVFNRVLEDVDSTGIVQVQEASFSREIDLIAPISYTKEELDGLISEKYVIQKD